MTIDMCLYHDCRCNDKEFPYSMCCKDCADKDKCPDRCDVDDCSSCYWMTRKEVKSNDG